MKVFTAAKTVSLIFCLTAVSVLADDSPPPEIAILARAHAIMRLPEGMSRGRIKHLHPGGASFTVDFKAMVSGDSSFFIFHSKERDEQLEALYTLGGENIQIYMTHSRRLVRKTGADKYEPVLYTNFSYIDFSGYRLADNYTCELSGEEDVNGRPCDKLELKPVSAESMYGRLTLYAAKENSLPLRIEFRDKNFVFIKVLTIARAAQKGDTIIPLRYEMRDVRSGDVSILVFNSFNEKIPPSERDIFSPDSMGK
ncbi:MAG: outer membrane lipoprotein-sorting protein [Leptospirales bacterium]|nr:outer membrane lipoprotein-sorting protein [Leptospirales bacterium]